jgi:O-antigen/teichoic acid export membrane protein
MATLVGNLGTAYTNRLRTLRADPNELMRVALLLAIGAGLVAGVALVPIDLALAPRGYGMSALVGAAVPCLVVTQALTGALLALGRLRVWNVLQALAPIAGLAALLVLVLGFGFGFRAALAGWCGAQAITAVAAVVATRRQLLPFHIGAAGIAALRPLMSFSLRIGLANLAALLNYRVEMLVLEVQRGVHSVGIYSLSAGLAELTWVVSAALAAAIVSPAVMRSDRRAAQTIARAARHSLVASTVVAIGLALSAPALVPAVFGAQFRGSVGALFILLPGVVMFAPGGALAVWFSMRVGRTDLVIGLALFSAALTCVAAVLLIPHFGINGAAGATTLGYGLSMLLVYALFVRMAPVRARDFVPGRADLEDYRQLWRKTRQVSAVAARRVCARFRAGEARGR